MQTRPTGAPVILSQGYLDLILDTETAPGGVFRFVSCVPQEIPQHDT